MGLLSPIFFILCLSTEQSAGSLFSKSFAVNTTRLKTSPEFDPRAQSVGFLTTKKAIAAKFLSRYRWMKAVDSTSQRLNLCEETKDFDSETVPSAECSVFAISSNLVLTASHCFENLNCRDARIVFSDLKVQDARTSFDSHDVYGCKRIKTGTFLSSERTLQDRSGDWALVELDRRISVPALAVNTKQFDLSKAGASKSVDLEYLGYMLSQSIKRYNGNLLSDPDQGISADQSTVREEVLLTNLSATGGASGAPVFEKNSPEVVGILVSGGRMIRPSEKSHSPACNELVTCSSQLTADELLKDGNCAPTRVLKIRSEMLSF